MKKTISILVALFSLSMMIAQPTTATKNTSVPNAVTNQFGHDYPYTSVDWTMDADKYYVGRYHDSSTEMPGMVVYDKQGKRMRTESQMADNTYPFIIDEYYTKQYPHTNYEVAKMLKEALAIISTKKGMSIGLIPMESTLPPKLNKKQRRLNRWRNNLIRLPDIFYDALEQSASITAQWKSGTEKFRFFQFIIEEFCLRRIVTNVIERTGDESFGIINNKIPGYHTCN